MTLGLEACRLLLSIQYVQLWLVQMPTILYWDAYNPTCQCRRASVCGRELWPGNQKCGLHPSFRAADVIPGKLLCIGHMGLSFLIYKIKF